MNNPTPYPLLNFFIWLIVAIAGCGFAAWLILEIIDRLDDDPAVVVWLDYARLLL